MVMRGNNNDSGKENDSENKNDNGKENDNDSQTPPTIRIQRLLITTSQFPVVPA